MGMRVFSGLDNAMKTDHQVELCRAYLHSTAAPESETKGAERPDGPVITISRAAGSRGSSIAAVLVRHLANDRTLPRGRPWTLFDQNLLQQVVKDHRLPESTEKYFPEDKPDEIRQTIGELLGLHPSAITTLRKIAETVRRISKTGNAVIVGRGGNFISPDIKRSVHVRLTGDESNRIRHFARRAGITQEEAAIEVAKLDRGRKRYIKSAFKRDIDDPRFYDLVINTDRFTDEQAAALILEVLRQRCSA